MRPAAETPLDAPALPEDDLDLAEHFGGQSGDEVDKLAGLDCTDGPGGVPLLARLPNRFVGRIDEAIPGAGDHQLYVLDVVGADVAPGVARSRLLRLREVTDIDPGHDADERR